MMSCEQLVIVMINSIQDNFIFLRFVCLNMLFYPVFFELKF